MSITTVLRTVRTRITRLSHDHPLLTNVALYGGLYTLAEVSQQKLRAKFGSHSTPHQMMSTSVPVAGSVTSVISSTSNGATVAGASLTSSPSHHRLDMTSVKRYAIMGTLVIAPIFTKWYQWLDNRFPATNRKTVIKKIILDQFLLTPWLLAMFFIGMAFLEGAKGKALLQELKEKFVKTFQLDCLYWIPIQAVNFVFVPPIFRVVFIGVTTFIWMNFLCFIKASPTVVALSKDF